MEHKCGIVAIAGKNIIEPLISGLNKLQHRGYESAGISYIGNCDDIHSYKNVGLVENVFESFDREILSSMAIGHVRYSTRKKDKDKLLEECQPFANEEFSIAHNGNIPFIHKIKSYYKIDCDNDSDTYILLKLMEMLKDKYTMDELLKYIIHNITGTYALVILTKDKIYALRDRYGIRPLVVMSNKTNSVMCVTSETVAFDMDSFDIIKYINPGEIVTINKQLQLNTIYQYANSDPHFCSFEYIYFMHHQSIHDNIHIELIRHKLGYELGLSEVDILENSVVIPIPNSSIPSATGFADAINSIVKRHIIKNENIKRTFILPTESERKTACAQKFIFVDCNELSNKNIYLIDDSIVRGTTIKHVAEQLKQFNPKSINVRITSPPVVAPCHYGIDMSTPNELIINNRNIESIEKELGVTSLNYLNIDPMKNVIGKPVCTSCFTGKYNKELLEW